MERWSISLKPATTKSPLPPSPVHIPHPQFNLPPYPSITPESITAIMPATPEVYIVSAVRTPIGSFQGYVLPRSRRLW